MFETNVLGLFCEDVREEKGGSVTLVGLMPDNINLDVIGEAPPDAARTMPKVCIYARVNFDVDQPVKNVDLHLIFTDTVSIPIGKIDGNVIDLAVKQAKEKDLPFAGVTMRAAINALNVPKPGIVRLEALVDGKTTLLAIMNVNFV